MSLILLSSIWRQWNVQKKNNDPEISPIVNDWLQGLPIKWNNCKLILYLAKRQAWNLSSWATSWAVTPPPSQDSLSGTGVCVCACVCFTGARSSNQTLHLESLQHPLECHLSQSLNITFVFFWNKTLQIPSTSDSTMLQFSEEIIGSLMCFLGVLRPVFLLLLFFFLAFCIIRTTNLRLIMPRRRPTVMSSDL